MYKPTEFGGYMFTHIRFMLTTAILLFAFAISVSNAEPIVADHIAVSEFDQIPDSVIEGITVNFNMYYVHTSHGSQIMTGLDMVEAEDALYEQPYCREVSDDLGHNGDTSWVPATRVYLDAHPECNLAMFSWCGGASDNTEEGINIYLNKMEELEADYPDIDFVYMTGHLDGGGPEGNLYIRNNQIRDYCDANDKILFDFADIESWDPDGNYYPDEIDACYWCYDWCALYTCPTCGSCAHSHCFNCYLKGKGFWWLLALVIGWNDNFEPTCGDTDGNGEMDIDDVVYLITYLYQAGPAPDPLSIGNVDCHDETDIDDVVYLIQYIFNYGPPPCDPDNNGEPDC